MPAAGQGALGITVRVGDAAAEAALAPLRNVEAATTTTAERSALHAMGAGCHAPVGALGTVAAGRLTLRVRVLSLDGKQVIEHQAEGPLSRASELGRNVASALLERGAGPLVEVS
jgi:hydroxymethylbilane synthase